MVVGGFRSFLVLVFTTNTVAALLTAKDIKNRERNISQ